MKRILLFLVAVSCSLIFLKEPITFLMHNPLNSSSSEQLLVLVLMVKNEEAVMKATLQPFLDASLDNYLILDTGSTDNTVAITKKLFEEYKVKHGYIVEEPFVDFSTSRNVALDYVEKKFPMAIFTLMIDAEWYMHNVKGLIKFCEENRNNKEISSVSLYGRHVALDFYTQRLFRVDKHVRFVGVVHEVPNQVSSMRIPTDVYFELRPEQYGIEKSQQRWLRDKDLFLKEFEKNPKNTRTLFYLGQTYECLGDWANAIIYYKKRCELMGGDEEDYVAHYRVGRAAENLGNWKEAEEYYLKAANMRPTRAEPLLHLSDHYWCNNNPMLAFLYAERAVELSYPQDDVLFIEKVFYDYNRYDLLSRAAYSIGEFEIGKKAALKGLESNPNNAQLLANLEQYLKREQQK